MMPTLLEATLRSATLALAAWLVLKALRVRDAHAEKLVWTVVIAVSLAMPVLMRTAALPLPAQTLSMMPVSAMSARMLVGGRHTGLATAALGVYLAVTAILLLRFLSSLHRAYRCYRQARQLDPDVRAGVRFRMSDAIRTPCTFAGVILLPAGFDSWSPTARTAALAHERSHVIHRDGYRLWLATVYCCVFWFNPVAWLVRRRLRLLAELTSDGEALRCVGDSAAYAQLLLHMASDISRLPAALAMSGSTQLAARIHRILEDNMISHHLSGSRRATLLGASILAAVLCSSCIGAAHVLSPAEDPKVSWVSGQPMGQFYPAALRKQRLEGYVVMKLAVDRSGHVTDADVVKENPAGVGFGAAAVNAARTFQFNNTLARPVIKTIQVKFALVD
jgi:TonB family protein